MCGNGVHAEFLRLTFLPGRTPLAGCKESNNWSYFPFSVGFTDQSIFPTSELVLLIGILGTSPWNDN